MAASDFDDAPASAQPAPLAAAAAADISSKAPELGSTIEAKGEGLWEKPNECEVDAGWRRGERVKL